MTRIEEKYDGKSIWWYAKEMGYSDLIAPRPVTSLDFVTERGGLLTGKRQQNACYLHDYGEGRYLLVQMKHKRPDYDKEKDPDNHYDHKLDNNVQRARSTIVGIAMCNEWDWFSTVTISPQKYDRADLDAYHKAYSRFLREEGRRCTGGKLSYLTVPEKHKNGEGWHEHGLIHGLPVDELRPFTLDEKLPHHIREKLMEGQKIYDWPRYRERFGFCDFEPIRSRDAVACYMTKYVTKTLAKDVAKVGAHTFYASQGLKRPQTLAAGHVHEWLPMEPGTTSFGNEHCAKRWFYGDAGLQEALSYMRPESQTEYGTCE